MATSANLRAATVHTGTEIAGFQQDWMLHRAERVQKDLEGAEQGKETGSRLRLCVIALPLLWQQQQQQQQEIEAASVLQCVIGWQRSATSHLARREAACLRRK